MNLTTCFRSHESWRVRLEAHKPRTCVLICGVFFLRAFLGHCVWEFEVIRRDQGMNLGVVLADAFAGQLDRRWDSKCFASKVHKSPDLFT